MFTWLSKNKNKAVGAIGFLLLVFVVYHLLELGVTKPSPKPTAQVEAPAPDVAPVPEQEEGEEE